MKPKYAIKHLHFLVDTQKTISTNKLRKIVTTLESYQTRLENDNDRFRKRVTSLRRANKKLRGKRK